VIYGKLVGMFREAFKKKNRTIMQAFSDEITTLPEILKIHGYTTFGVASNHLLDEETGFARGFDYFEKLNNLPAPSVNKTIYSWEDEIKKSDKFFLWAHYFDPHHPYHARAPWINRYTSIALTNKLNLFDKTKDQQIISILKKYPQAQSNYIALYDSEIHFVDSYIGKLIQKFELDKNTLIIITADHGEEFLEHGEIGHGWNLYKATINIPLIVKLPNSSKKETVENYVSLIDIEPTISHILNINSPQQTLGKSFLGRRWPLDYNFAELYAKKTILKTIMTPEWKYIYDYYDNIEELYNIKSDPLELNNLIDREIKQANKLKEQLFMWVLNSKKYPAKRKPFLLSPEEREKLEALGYLK
jgi:arylsulfatase A-like enzyme